MNELDFSEISKLSEKYNKEPQSRLFVQLADAYRKNNMIEEALDVLNKGLNYHPQYPLAYLVLGKCHFDKRAYVQARDAFEKTLALDPQNVVALRMLARTYEMLKDDKGQLNAYKNIIAIDPLDTNAKEKLSMLEALQRKEPLYTVAMAEEYEKQGNLEESLKIYENLLFTDPSDLMLKEKVAELKKALDERKRKIEGTKIEEMRVEPVFKPGELITGVGTGQTAAPREEKPEPQAPVEEGIQSLEDFLVEELELASEKVVTDKPTDEPPAEPVQPETTAAPEEDAVAEVKEDAGDAAVKPSEAQVSEPIALPEASFGNIALDETEQKPVTEEPRAEIPVTPSEHGPAMPMPGPEPAVQDTAPKERITEETTDHLPEPEVKEPGTEQAEQKPPGADKTKEEDFKSFQDWLSGLLK